MPTFSNILYAPINTGTDNGILFATVDDDLVYLQLEKLNEVSDKWVFWAEPVKD